MNEQIKIQKTLHRALAEIQTKNPSYSVRAFSKKLGLTSGTVSLVMLGKRKVSQKLAQQIADKLMLDPQERSEILGEFSKKNAQTKVSEDFLKITADQFSVTSEWYHFAILNLIKTKDFKSDVNWIAERLALTPKKVEGAIERLKRVGLLTVDEQGEFYRSKNKFRTDDDIADISLRKSHHETLDLAHESLDRDPVTQRDFTWTTFAFDVENMQEAKVLIRKCQDDILALNAESQNKTEVYRLAVQLFPLTKLNGDKK
ncbi:MAG: DUF4423 domain-containing protein [Bacteriovoracaceae bacterium]